MNKLFKNRGSARAAASDCGGVCNNQYWHAIEAAATNLALATGIGFAVSWFGGPAGIAAGAGTIAGSIIAYYIAEHFALIGLGDCFSACPMEY